MAISRRRDAEAAQRAVVQAHFDAENAQIAAKRAAEEASAEPPALSRPNSEPWNSSNAFSRCAVVTPECSNTDFY